MAEEPLVSLIICTYNRNTLLVDTITCALQQDYKNLEILVIDQTEQHDKETLEYLSEIASRIHYIFLETPSLTKARNVGLQNAKGNIIIFIDDDTLFDQNFVREHVAMHDKGYDVVQGRIIEEGDPLKPNARPQWLTWYVKFTGTNNCETEGITNTITGCNFSIKKQVVEKIGFFDERFTGMAVREDADYGIRCFRQGVRMFFAPKACVNHVKSLSGGVDTGIGNHFFSHSYYYNEMLFCSKHFKKPIQFYYTLRLYLRGWKALKKLIRNAISIL